MGQLDLSGSLKAEVISISSDMRQVAHDCKDIIDLSQPPPGYTMEDFKRLADAVNTELCKMGDVQCAPVG
jgi:L-serine deaminase